MSAKGFGLLFSAYAEVFLSVSKARAFPFPFLCLRRGVSGTHLATYCTGGFSLPTQRCFCILPFSFFPHATFLCLRRGVSIVAPFPAGTDYFSLPTQRCFNRRGDRHTVPSNFSLPTQRCFHHSLSYSIRSHLFSAYAEVFLKSPKISLRVHSFLCLRRGVSGGNGCVRDGSNFSLPTQRCFRYATRSLPFFHLFSAYAEVFPTRKGKRGGA